MSRTPNDADKRELIAQQNQTVVSYFYCPSRRAPQARPMVGFQPRNSAPLSRVVRTDYAANSGDFGDGNAPGVSGPQNNPAAIAAFMNQLHRLRHTHTGVMFGGSETTPSQISDGLSNTLLLGEKNLDPNHYDTGRNINDNQGAFTGFNWDNCRVIKTSAPPSPDTPGTVGNNARSDWAPRFGSAHKDVWLVGYCDGSVSSLSYSVQIDVARRLANRRDGQFTQRPN
jgi:hypothetical protein